MADETQRGCSRRAFCAQATGLIVLGGALPGLLVGCGGSPTAPTNVPALPVLSGTRVNNGVNVTIDTSSPLAAIGSAALVQSSAGNFLVARTGDTSFSAVTALCTHQDCTITGLQGQTYVCPCHGSEFDQSGHVVQGPASIPLKPYTSSFAAGLLTIAV
jgi:Rieske Fe-S protein